MNENGRKRREWVKTVAIIFLSIMLVLTFFSQTIMNYSLPEVAAQYVQSGNITAKIRGTGMIESGDPYNVKIVGTRKVASVAVREGDKVEAGEVLCVLSSEDSAELEAAKEALKAAQKDYDSALLTGTLNAVVMNEAGTADSIADYKARVLKLQKEVEAAKAEVKKWQDTYDAYEVQIAWASVGSTVDVSAEEAAVKKAQEELDKAQLALTEAQNNKTAIELELSYRISVNADASVIENLEKHLKSAEYTAICAQTTYNGAALKLERAQKTLEDKQEGDATNADVENMKKLQAYVQVDLTKAQQNLSAKETALAEAVKNINDQIFLADKFAAVEEAKAQVAKLETEVSGAEVTAPISGTIMTVNVRSGLETPSDGIVFTMQPEGEGFTMSFTVTNEQAKRLSIGDVAEPVNAWRYDNMQIVLESIRPDKMNPAQNKLLVFSVSGDNIVANQSINVSVGQRSSTYDMIVPNSAIREDNNGKFVLVVESKSSPLGNRYIANRVDVEVIASDDTQSAITGGLYGWEFVITTSSKPIEAGQQVRLPE